MESSKCTKCERRAVIFMDAGERPLCAHHYVKEEDDGCLEAFIVSSWDINDKIDNEIVQEIKKQKPKLYEKRKHQLEL